MAADFKAIRRRPLLTGGVTLFASLAARRLSAMSHDRTLRRAAVVIGIDNYPHLPHLAAAVSGAEEMAAFFDAEGFETTLFTDRSQPVEGSALFGAVAGHVDDPAGLDQLVIYFSGHGFVSGTTEIWMLSNAPYDTAEAVSVLESAQLAYQSNIPNVVLISDACRSLPDDLGSSQVTGRKIFPAGRTPDRQTDVDLFFATRPGAVSLELPMQTSVPQHEGIYTSAFLKAFREPTRDMIYQLGDGVNVIPNRKLRDFLFREVSDRAQAHSIRLNQYPEARITSDIPTFIGHSQIAPDEVSHGNRSDVEPADVAVPEAIRKAVQDVATGNFDGPVVQPLSVAPRAVRDASELVLTAVERQREDIEMEATGLVVYGTRIERIETVGLDAYRPFETDGADVFEVPLGDRAAATVAVTFEDGSGTLVGLLNGFGTHLNVAPEGIVDLRFNPTQSHYLHSEFRDRLDWISLLRGLASEASRQGALVFEGSREERQDAARQFANQVRMGKGMDPTLGIFAAYAYADGFFDRGAQSVHRILRESLSADVFDTAMLAGDLDESGQSEAGFPVIPPFPAMRQGWEYLRVRGVTLPEVLQQVRPMLMNSLWTTFAPDAAQVLADAVAQGQFGGPPR